MIDLFGRQTNIGCLCIVRTVVTDQSLKDKLKLTYLVGEKEKSGLLIRPLIGRLTGLNMFNILVKNPTDLLISWSL